MSEQYAAMSENLTTRQLEIREAILSLHESMQPDPSYDTTDNTRQEQATFRLASLLGSEEAARAVADALAWIHRAR